MQFLQMSFRFYKVLVADELAAFARLIWECILAICKAFEL